MCESFVYFFMIFLLNCKGNYTRASEWKKRQHGSFSSWLCEPKIKWNLTSAQSWLPLILIHVMISILWILLLNKKSLKTFYQSAKADLIDRQMEWKWKILKTFSIRESDKYNYKFTNMVKTIGNSNATRK